MAINETCNSSKKSKNSAYEKVTPFPQAPFRPARSHLRLIHISRWVFTRCPCSGPFIFVTPILLFMKLKQFQREDLARAALHDGLILGLDTGLGKTICAYVWPLLKVGLLRRNGKPVRPICPAEPVLLITSGDLHDQIISEGRKYFGTAPTILDTQQTFLRLSTLSAAGRRELAPGYYLTTYTQLSRNGVTPFPELDKSNPERMLKVLNLSQKHVEEFFGERAERYQKHYLRLGATHQDTEAQLKSKWFQERKHANSYRQEELDESYYIVKDFAPKKWRDETFCPLEDLSAEQQLAVTARFVEMAHASMSRNIGESRYFPRIDREIKCLYSPTLADLCQDSFAVVVADEGIKIKGEDTLIGKGTRQMNPKYRLPMTATPIKNRLPDVLDRWTVQVTDKARKIKGEDTPTGKATRQKTPRSRLPMTATPIKNRLPDV